MFFGISVLSGSLNAAETAADADLLRQLAVIELNEEAFQTQPAVSRLPPGVGLLDGKIVYEKVSQILKSSGVPQGYVDSIFKDSRLAVIEKTLEAIHKPAESLPYEEYRKRLITEKRINDGVQFYNINKQVLFGAAQSKGIDPLILLSITGIESSFGQNRGAYIVTNALYTLSRMTSESRPDLAKKWQERGPRDLAAFIKYAHKMGFDPFGITGSYAGAFGFCQFMPLSVEVYAVDFNNDGIIDLYNWADVFGSIANYLAKSGYKPDSADYSPGGDIWKAIYAYNHYENYVKVILDLRLEIKKKVEAAP